MAKHNQPMLLLWPEPARPVEAPQLLLAPARFTKSMFGVAQKQTTQPEAPVRLLLTVKR